MTRLALMVALGALAMYPQRAQPFRSRVEGVQVDVLVTEGNRPVANLTRDDFVLLDNAVPQSIDTVSIDDVPLSLLLALDVSTSVRESLDDLKNAAHAALDALEPQDSVALVTFSQSVRLLATFTMRHQEVAASVDVLRASGSTSLYDGTYTALTLHDDEPGRRALVLIFSDGADTASWLPESVVAARAQRTDAVVYAIAVDPAQRNQKLMWRSGIELLPDSGVARTPSEFLREIAAETGGRVYDSQSMGGLRSQFESILKEFRSRYLLTYTPRGVDTPGWHAIDVQLKGRSGHVRARRGYFK